MTDINERHRAEVNVAYDGTEWPVELKGMTTVREILLSSLINHGLPVLAHEDFALLHADGGAVSDPSGNAIFAGVKPGDTLILKYLRAAGES